MEDLDYGLVSFYGPYETVVEAMEFADAHQTRLDRDVEPGNRGWTSTVHPMSRG